MAAKVKVSPVVAAGYAPLPQTVGEEKVVHAILPLDAVALEAGDVLDMLILPPECVVTDLLIHADDLDTNASPTLTLDVGLISGIPGDTTVANRTVGVEAGNNLTTAQAAALARNLLAALMRVPAQPVPRSLGFKVEAGPATAVVETGTMTTNRGQWKPGTAYATGDFLVLPNGVKMSCTTAGTSGTYGQTEAKAPTQAQPNWNLTFGGTTADGGVTWTCRSPIIGMIARYTMSRQGLPL